VTAAAGVALLVAQAAAPLAPSDGGTLAAEAPAPAPVWSVPVGHAAGVLVGMRLGLTVIWPQAYDPRPFHRSAEQFKLAYTRPPEYRTDRSPLESDGDPWAINVVGHGLFGAEIYGRVRQCHGAVWQALAFTAGTSALWEYGLESFTKRPSTVDLILTPALGAALGEGRYRLQRWLATRPPSLLRRVVEVIIDPLGEGERGLLHTRC
jgi:hypothetical protein